MEHWFFHSAGIFHSLLFNFLLRNESQLHCSDLRSLAFSNESRCCCCECGQMNVGPPRTWWSDVPVTVASPRC
jgi:hypothetical protein